MSENLEAAALRIARELDQTSNKGIGNSVILSPKDVTEFAGRLRAEWLAEGQEPCNTVTVRAEYIDWLKTHYPALCEKSGLCERIGGRLYTKTILHPAPKEVEKGSERIAELERDLFAVAESVDIALDRLHKYQCEGRSIASIHDVFEVLRLASSIRATIPTHTDHPSRPEYGGKYADFHKTMAIGNPATDCTLPNSECPSCDSRNTKGCRLTEEAAPATDPQEAEDEFKSDDPDLHELLNWTASLLKGKSNMDGGLMWLDCLKRVEGRLKTQSTDPQEEPVLYATLDRNGDWEGGEVSSKEMYMSQSPLYTRPQYDRVKLVVGIVQMAKDLEKQDAKIAEQAARIAELQSDVQIRDVLLSTHQAQCAKNIAALTSQRDRLVNAVKEVLRISDRKHDAWDAAKAVLAEIEKEQPK